MNETLEELEKQYKDLCKQGQQILFDVDMFSIDPSTSEGIERFIIQLEMIVSVAKHMFLIKRKIEACQIK